MAGEGLPGWLALSPQQLAHLPEKPVQRRGDGEDGWTVAAVGRQLGQRGCWRSAPGSAHPAPAYWGSAPCPRAAPLCEDILQQVVQAGLLGRAGRQQAGNEVAALGDRWVGSG